MDFYDEIVENTKKSKKEKKENVVDDCLKIAMKIKEEIKYYSNAGSTEINIWLGNEILNELGTKKKDCEFFIDNDVKDTLVSVLEKTIGYRFKIVLGQSSNILKISVYWKGE